MNSLQRNTSVENKTEDAHYVNRTKGSSSGLKFNGFTEETVQFFLDLRFHNYTEYFHAQHNRYIETVQKPFYNLIETLAPEMRKIDPLMEIRPHKCLSRIHRDTRFTKDKSPYRDHLWFLFRRAAEPREKSLFYFAEFGPDRLNWGMGIWGENREVMDQFRKRMEANPEGMLARIEDLDLAEHHLILGGSSFKRMNIPTEIPVGLQPWYRSREMFVGKWDPDYRWSFSGRLVTEIQADFRRLAPLYQMLRGIYDELG